MMNQDANQEDSELKKLKERAEELKPRYPVQSFKDFLASSPPDKSITVMDLEATSDARGIDTPDVMLHCDQQDCHGPRYFRCGEVLYADKGKWYTKFLYYRCRNCDSSVVIFAIGMLLDSSPTAKTSGKATVFKFGQSPTFGPQLPSRLISLIGPDREMFLQGFRAENRGLGIGAFAYYRRVVENQKNRIIGEIAKVARTVGAPTETLELFERAVNETRFSESLDMVRDVIPQTLLIHGQNPLALLHTALSRGLHNPEMTDAHCLAVAQSIRLILTELSDRSSQALKDNKEIQDALGLLMTVPRGTISLD